MAGSEVVAAGFYYATRGWPIFPLTGKRPLTVHGVKDATTDPDAIADWLNRWPDANVGIATGSASGLVVLDVDGPDGDTSLKSLEERVGKLPATLEVRTGNAGRHLYFVAPTGSLIRNSAGRLGVGLDVRGEGGYVVAPPSTHPVTLCPYSWSNALDPAPFPQSLAALLSSTKPAVSDSGVATKILEGRRNVTLTSVAGSMRRRGLNASEIERALLAYNAEHCEPLLREEEVQRIARSVSRYAPGETQDVRPSKSAPSWPRPLGPAAFHGVLGELVQAIEPNTESDPAALLLQTLAMFGNVLGRSAHWRVEADTHYLTLNVVLVGVSSKGRKGVSGGHARNVFSRVDPEWDKLRTTSGLSSGEGLIWAVRDAITAQQPIKERGRVTEYQTVVEDPGVSDKRLLVLESEFTSTLRVLSRDGNTLSALIRQAWDGHSLSALTKNSPARATGAHISIIGHITQDELRRDLDQIETANGFGNRFLWVSTRRSKALPDGGAPIDVTPFVDRLKAIVEFGKGVGEMVRDSGAKALWHRVYPTLSDGLPGLLGAMTARAEAQVMRIACLYALADQSDVVREVHLRAALEVWRYCFDSARHIFGERLGDRTADELLRALRAAGPSGLTRSQILRDVFMRNQKANEIERALSVLERARLARKQMEPADGGRPTERWFVTDDVNDVDDVLRAANG